VGVATARVRDAGGSPVVDPAAETVRLSGSVAESARLSGTVVDAGTTGDTTGEAVASDAAYRIILPGQRGPSADGGTGSEASPAEVGTGSEAPFDASLQPDEVSVLGTLPPAVVEVAIDNQSGIVEAYDLDIPDAPDWLGVQATEVSLLPGTADSARLTLAIPGTGLVLAQRLPLRVRIRARSDERLVRWADLVVVVPPVDGPIPIEMVPSLVRVLDGSTAEVTVRAQNRTGNRPARFTLAGSDAEMAIRFAFYPPILEIPPGGEASARVIMQPPRLEPGRERSHSFTLAATDSTRTVSTNGTLVHATSAVVVDPPVGVQLQPSLLRVTNSSVGELTVVVDNGQGRLPAGVQLSGTDPELAIRFAFDPPTFTVPPGRSVSARGRLEAAPPTPGGECTRPFTITAAVGDRTASRTGSASGSFVQVATPLVAVGLGVEPAVVRVEGGTARFTLTVDNRGSATGIRVAMVGSDPERVVQFDFVPPVVDIPAGGVATVNARVRAPRAERGGEVTRELDFWADDGRAPVRAHGMLIQSSASLRPMLRVLLTVLGVAAMVGGCFLDWTASPPRTAAEWTVTKFADAIHASRSIFLFPDVENALPSIFFSAAIVVLLLAAVALFGLTGKTGRLTRIAAVVCAAFVVAFLMALHFRGASGQPAIGSITVMVGCVVAFGGGLMARR
jgi:P pilus assembly chaperone PapD